jgi:3'(2'), 5'-bisphosphate nucleotidase
MGDAIDTKSLVNLLIETSIEAGKAILEVYKTQDPGIEYKKDDSPLTKADLASHQVIAKALEQTGIPLLSEEGEILSFEKRKDLDTLWIVDPLDGTKEFIKRNGEFTVNIALVQDHLPILGVVFAPVTRELFYAGEGIGAKKYILEDLNIWSIEEIYSDAKPLPIPQTGDDFKVVASRSHLTSETEEYINSLKKKHQKVETTSRGSSLKLCMVAEGAAQCYPRFAPTMEWDTAAGHAICKFSGATVTDWSTKSEMKYNKEDLLNNWFVVRQ